MTTLNRPIIILGSLRSGTTMLGNLLKRHPDIAYWEEPKHIWRHRHAYRSHDLLTEADVTPAISDYIHDQFSDFLASSGRVRFMEKTPSNCLRIPFIRTIFPDLQIVHVIRDGRASALSARVQWKNDYMVPADKALEGVSNSSYAQSNGNGADKTSKGIGDSLYTVRKFLAEKNRLSGGMWTYLEAPAYIPALGRVFARKLTKDRSFIWGTRFPGIAQAHRSYSLIETCALQWWYSVKTARQHTQDLSDDQYLEFRFEDFVQSPDDHLHKIFSFLDVADSAEIRQYAQETINPTQINQWQSRATQDEIAKMESWIGPLLKELGYQLEATS